MKLDSAKQDRAKRLALILITAFVGIAIIVFGGTTAMQRDVDQYARGQIDGMIENFEKAFSDYYTPDKPNFNAAVASSARNIPLGESQMVIAGAGSESLQVNHGANVPTPEQTGVLSDPQLRSKVQAPGEGRMKTSAGEFYYASRTIDSGKETGLMMGALYMDDLDEMVDQSRKTMILLGLGTFLLIAIAAMWALPSDDEETAKEGGNASRTNVRPAPAQTRVIPAVSSRKSETRASATRQAQTIAVPARGSATMHDADATDEIYEVDDPRGTGASTSCADVPTAPTPEEHAGEIRASDFR